ncbi:MAG TPA: hypothetical protein VN154_07390 [Rhizomicrobium sp.]|nr:hypothetical protein [Rhizomicrobium sp.]
MHNTNWGDLAERAAALVARQPPFLQILVVLGAVFAILMILEGLRVNFLVGAARKIRHAQPRASRLEPGAPDFAVRSAHVRGGNKPVDIAISSRAKPIEKLRRPKPFKPARPAIRRR